MAGFLMGLSGLPEGVSPETFLGPELGAAAAPGQTAGMAAGMVLPLPGGAKRQLVGEAVEHVGPLARNLGEKAATVFHGSGLPTPPDLDAILRNGPMRGWAASPGIYATSSPTTAARYAEMPTVSGRVSTNPGVLGDAVDMPPVFQQLLLALKLPTMVDPAITGLRPAVHDAAKWLKTLNPDALVERARWVISQLSNEELAKFFSHTPGHPGGPGFIYEMKMHADPNRIVDWAKDVLKQPAEVREGFMDVLPKIGQADAAGSTTGSALISRVMRTLEKDKALPEMPALMRSAGIEGVKYPSGAFIGTTTREPVTNYALYGNDLLEVIKRYPLLGVLLGTATAGFTRRATAGAETTIK